MAKKPEPELYDVEADIIRSHHRDLGVSFMNSKGHEVPDPVPVAPPIGYRRTPSLAEQIREMVRSERLRQEVEAAGYESFEEADDFEVGDFDPRSPYEEVFEPTPAPELRKRHKKAADDAEAAKQRASEPASQAANVGGVGSPHAGPGASGAPSQAPSSEPAKKQS